MGRFLKPCLDCGELSKGSRCPTHQARIDAIRERERDTPERREKKRLLYNSDYKKRAKIVRETATNCHLCGGGIRLEDPFEADHLVPGNPASPLAAAHRSCNQQRGNKPL